jgi:murein L,D-transpeptidase YcbB/YkuD
MRYRQNLTYQQIFVLAMIALFFAACNGSVAEKQSEIIEKPEQMDAAITRNLKSFISNAVENNGMLTDSVKLQSYESVYQFYKKNEFANIWSKQELLLPVADTLIQFIGNCKLYGLFPKEYHQNQLQALQQLFNLDTLAQSSRRDAVLWTKADILLTDAFLSIAKHIHKGRLQTDSIYKSFDSSLGQTYYHQFLNEAVHKGSVHEIFSKLEPKHKAYHELKKAIKPFLDSANFSQQYTYLSYPYKDSVSFVKSLIQRLKEENYIDSAVFNLDSTGLKQALIKVQKQRKLTVDGKFGNQLVSSLNSSDIEKFTRIAINLDRYKLMPDTLPVRYIWVNLPSFYMQVMDHDSLVFESKVVVGKVKTRTPLLSSIITDMVTYPQWTIPNSIIIKEILPALKKNPGYLAKKGYHLATWKGEEVDPYSVNWSKYTKGIPYKIVQGSGDDNALGIMKFNFPNKYSVYMHDTNQRYLFKNDNRSLSHGCVRVQQWEQLVWYISGLDSVAAVERNMKSLPTDSMRNWLQRKEKHVIPVKTKLPVYFRYFTAVGKNGKLVFYNDIYNEDRLAREGFFSNK